MKTLFAISVLFLLGGCVDAGGLYVSGHTPSVFVGVSTYYPYSPYPYYPTYYGHHHTSYCHHYQAPPVRIVHHTTPVYHTPPVRHTPPPVRHPPRHTPPVHVPPPPKKEPRPRDRRPVHPHNK